MYRLLRFYVKNSGVLIIKNKTQLTNYKRRLIINPGVIFGICHLEFILDNMLEDISVKYNYPLYII